MVAGEKITGKYVQISSAKKYAEYVPGIKNCGLRTDGYSTCVMAALPAKTNTSLNISGWFALETLPTDTAGFFGFKNNSSYRVSACINKLGKPMIGVGTNNISTYFSADIILSTFKWLHITLQINEINIDLLINGKKVLTVNKNIPVYAGAFDSVYIGRDIRMTSIGLFPANSVNGIIDEIVVRKSLVNGKEYNNKNFQEDLLTKPHLDVPAIHAKILTTHFSGWTMAFTPLLHDTWFRCAARFGRKRIRIII